MWLQLANCREMEFIHARHEFAALLLGPNAKGRAGRAVLVRDSLQFVASLFWSSWGLNHLDAAVGEPQQKERCGPVPLADHAGR